MKIDDFVMAEYNNGESVHGTITKIRHMGEKGGEALTWADGRVMDFRTLVTVKTDQGYRSIYLDKCLSFKVVEPSVSNS